MADIIIAKEHIFETSDYSKFQRHVGNRVISEAGVRDKIASITKSGYIRDHPVLVARSKSDPHLLLILDGQHRVEACIRLGLPVIYKISSADHESIDEYVQLNVHQRSWGNEDFLHSYAERGFPEYIKTKKFVQKHKIAINTLLGVNRRLNFFLNENDVLREEFKAGLAAVNELGQDFAGHILEELAQIGKACDAFKRIMYQQKLIISYIWFSSSSKFELKRFIEGCQRRPGIVGHPSESQGLDVRHLMEIYNYRLSENNKIRFAEAKKGTWIEV